MVDTNETTKAREIAENLVWRLEVLQHRCRYNLKTGAYKQLPTRIRRFANARPTDLVAAVIDELVKMAPYKGVVFCGEDDSDLSYRPTTTSIRKDDSLKTGSRDATYTIIQDLLLDGETDTYLGSDGSSCSQVSSVEYYWDEADVAACPDAEQGVVYQVADVSRDRETDLFSFKIRKTQAVTQHVAEYVTECSDDSQKTVETWDNVYGEQGAFTFDSVIHGGEAIELPEPCESAQGTLVHVEVAQNPDCTFKVAVTRVTSKTDDAEFLRYRDQFQIRTSDLYKNQAESLSKEGVEYGDGVKTTYKSSSNPDGTFNNEISTETERPVPSAVTGAKRTLRGLVTTTVNKNQAEPASLTGLAVGSEVRNERTPGGLYDVTLVTTSNQSVGTIAAMCQKTSFEHTDEWTENQSSKPSTEVRWASGGLMYSKSARRTEEGTWDLTVRSTQELGYTGAVVETRRTAVGTVTTVTDRNQRSPLSSAGLAVGESVRSEVTPGGLFNLQRTRVSVSETMQQSGCEDSGGVSHTDRTVHNQKTMRSNHASARPNTVVRTSSRLTEFGTYDNETSTTTFTPTSRTVTGGSMHAVTELTTGVNQTSVSGGTPAQNVSDDISVSLNEHGSMTVQRRKTTFTPVVAKAVSNWATETVTTTTTKHAATLDVSASFGDVSVTPDDLGAATTVVTTTVPRAIDTGPMIWTSNSVTKGGTVTYTHECRVFRNLKTPPLPSVGGSGNYNVSVNKYGLFDGSINYANMTGWSETELVEAKFYPGMLVVYLHRTAQTGVMQERPVFIMCRTFYGGETAVEVDAKANAVQTSGISLPPRTYAYQKPTYGSWVSV